VVVDLVAGVSCSGVVVSVYWSSVPVNNVAVVVDGCGCDLWACGVIFVVGIVDGGVVDGRGVVVGGGDTIGGVYAVVDRRWGGGGVGRVVWMGVESTGLVYSCGGGVVWGVVFIVVGFRLPSLSLITLVLAFCPARCCSRTLTLFYWG
jgi:hypothetical protein